MQESKYQVVVDWIVGEIAAGRLQPGDRLMSEKSMCEKFGLCRQTIRRATSELMEEKIVTRLQGSGTYIGTAGPKIRRERHMNIAVISTFYESYIFPPILKGIEKVLSKAGYATQVSFTDNKMTNERWILKNILQKKRVDGVIIEPSEGALPNSNYKYYQELLKQHIPLIFFNDAYPEIQAPCVRLDDYQVCKEATQLLLKSGHKKIAGIFKVDDGQGRRRFHGYVDAMTEAGVKVNPKNAVWIDTIAQMELERLSEYLFHRMEGCTGLVCYNDQVAMQMIDIAMGRGVSVPEDLSVVGIDDSNLSQMCKVPITSFAHPKEILGKKAAENLLQMIENPFFDGNYLFEPQVILRDSIREISGI